MYKETCKTTKFIDFKIQKYSQVWQFSSILTLSFYFWVSWEIQMCAVPSHPMGRFPWDSHRNDIPMDKPDFYIVWFTFSRIFGHSSFGLYYFFRLCIFKQKHGKASKKSYKPLVPLKLLLQSWTKGTLSSLLTFWTKSNRPASDGLQNVTYYPAVS